MTSYLLICTPPSGLFGHFWQGADEKFIDSLDDITITAAAL
jgi:hypothetical protein